MCDFCKVLVWEKKSDSWYFMVWPYRPCELPKKTADAGTFEVSLVLGFQCTVSCTMSSQDKECYIVKHSFRDLKTLFCAIKKWTDGDFATVYGQILQTKRKNRERERERVRERKLQNSWMHLDFTLLHIFFISYICHHRSSFYYSYSSASWMAWLSVAPVKQTPVKMYAAK